MRPTNDGQIGNVSLWRIPMSIQRSMCLLPFWLLVSTAVFATPVLHVESGVFLYGPATYDVKDSVTTNAGSSLSRSFTSSFSYGALGAQIGGFYTFNGFASFGVLRGSISSGISGDEFYPSISVYTLGYFQDTLTFNTPLSAGGTAYLVFTIDGSGSSSQATNPSNDGSSLKRGADSSRARLERRRPKPSLTRPTKPSA
jgi:hypothetical protein